MVRDSLEGFSTGAQRLLDDNVTYYEEKLECAPCQGDEFRMALGEYIKNVTVVQNLLGQPRQPRPSLGSEFGESSVIGGRYDSGGRRANTLEVIRSPPCSAFVDGLGILDSALNIGYRMFRINTASPWREETIELLRIKNRAQQNLSMRPRCRENIFCANE